MKSIEKPLTIILVIAFLGLVYLWKTERIGDHSVKDVKIETIETDTRTFTLDTIVETYEEEILWGDDTSDVWDGERVDSIHYMFGQIKDYITITRESIDTIWLDSNSCKITLNISPFSILSKD